MKNRLSPLFLLVAALLSPPLLASDEADLQQAFQGMAESVRNKDREAFLSYCHPLAVLLPRGRLYPLDFNAPDQGLQRGVDLLFADSVSLDYVPVELTFRVVGQTGIVYGLGQLRRDSRSGSGSDDVSRLTITFVKEGERWLMLNWHASALPGGN